MADPRSKTDVEQTPRSQRETGHQEQRGGLATRAGGGLSRGGLRDPLTTLRHQIDRMFDDFAFGGGLLRSPFFGRDIERSMWSPQIEVYEKDGRLHVCADLPGMDKNDVKVELHDNVLTIEGERRSEREEGGFSERSYGRFFRSIPLPEGTNADTANAKFENGVLDITLELPKKEQPRGRRIDIQ